LCSGGSELALAIGVERPVSPDDPARVSAIFATAIDQLEPER
jgi:hypothetical protein